jgi:hypothetical protein
MNPRMSLTTHRAWKFLEATLIFKLLVCTLIITFPSFIYVQRIFDEKNVGKCVSNK